MNSQQPEGCRMVIPKKLRELRQRIFFGGDEMILKNQVMIR